MIERVGFADGALVAETGFNSSPKTKGVLFRATKAVKSIAEERDKKMEDAFGKYQRFFDQTYAEGALDRKTKHLIALGASLGAGCEG